MIRHRLMLAWYEMAWAVCRLILRQWLWGGPWESDRVIEWFTIRIAAPHYYHEHMLTG